MARNLINNYVWLVETIYRAGRITFGEINQKWLDEEMDDKPIAPRTFHKWRITAEEMFNINIECKRVGGYHYYIENIDDFKNGRLRNWLFSTMAVSNLLLSCQSLKDRILLEDVPSGQDHLAVILEAMKTNAQLTVDYKTYWSDEIRTYNNLHPYCIKLFKQRWYLIAFNPFIEEIMILALDRVKYIEKLNDETFTLPDAFIAEDYFQNYYGIIAGAEGEPETVKLKVSAGQANYFRSLPLHSSQQEIESDDEYSIFTLRICPEYDFQQEILSNGEDVEVLEPQWLREEIAGKVNRLCNKYNKI